MMNDWHIYMLQRYGHLTALDSDPYYLHLYDSISLKQCGLCLGIEHKGIPAQSHHTVMTLRIQRHKQNGSYGYLNIGKCN